MTQELIYDVLKRSPPGRSVEKRRKKNILNWKMKNSRMILKVRGRENGEKDDLPEEEEEKKRENLCRFAKKQGKVKAFEFALKLLTTVFLLTGIQLLPM